MKKLSKKKREEPQSEKTAENVNEAAAQETEERTETSPEPDKTAEELKAKTEELAAEHDRYLRLMAEYDNFRKRSQKEREALFTDVRADTVLKLLPVYDNLARALQNETADEAYRKGVEMTMTQLETILEKMGVSAIPAVGESFNPERHNAVMHIEDENFGENEIVDEFEKGFMLGERVIRFSMVKVAN